MPTTTIGRVMVNDALPESFRGSLPVLDKKGVSKLFQDIAEKAPDQYEDTLYKLNQISSTVGYEYGRQASLRLDDLKATPLADKARKELKTQVDSIAQREDLNSDEKDKQIVELVREKQDELRTIALDDGAKNGNALALSAQKGFRGNSTQFSQLVLGDLLVSDNRDRPVPLPGLTGYGEGLSPMEYWAGSYGARKGFASVQDATAKAGFIGKQLANTAHRVVVTAEDCGATNIGLPMGSDDPDTIGRVLAKDYNGIPAGTVLSKDNISKLGSSNVRVRMASTCLLEDGVCKKCAGLRDGKKFPNIGDHIGITSARVIAEPITQAGLGAKHVGGTVGVTDRNLSGLAGINQFIQVPERFMGASLLAPEDGKISNITKAPQGGFYVSINDKQMYLEPGVNLLVKPGENVEAGDMISEGTPNPALITKYKGIGEGRRYFLEKFTKILKDSGASSHSRNVDVLARSFINRVRITDPDGFQGHLVGDIVPYTTLQAQYVPRENAKDISVKHSYNKYLEKPILHYTIGTRVTPSVQRTLLEEGIGTVFVHDDPPPFEPEVPRMMSQLQSDPDWKTRLSGWGIERGFMDAVQKGSFSPTKSTSFIGQVMNPTRL